MLRGSQPASAAAMPATTFRRRRRRRLEAEGCGFLRRLVLDVPRLCRSDTPEHPVSRGVPRARLRRARLYGIRRAPPRLARAAPLARPDAEPCKRPQLLA